MKMLVTGGAGFIGSHLVDKLSAKNEVVVIDNLSTGKKENLNKKAKFYKADICSPAISLIFEKEKPQIIFHFAARVNVRKSFSNPVDDAKINILGTLNLLENCKKYKARKFIFASSVGVYGEPKVLPVKEEHPLNPTSPYSVTKLAIEKYLNHYQNLGLDFVSLRFANIYGPRQRYDGEGGVVAIFINKILRGEKPIIFGRGKQTRDFLYVGDAVRAAILAMQGFPGSIYNTGTNRQVSINYLLGLISKILKIKVKPAFQPSLPGEILKSRLNYSKIKKEIGWQPRYSLERGLKETINWFKA